MRLRNGMASLAVLLAACGGGGSGSAAQPGPAAGPSSAPGPNAVAPSSPADPRPAAAAPAAPAAASATAGPNLYTRLGGVDAIRAVVDDFVNRVAADARINAFFRGVDIANLKRLLTEQICQATGGPCRYSGRTMEVTHAGLNLTEAHFNALVEDLVAALDRFNVPAAEKGELLTALGGMKSSIIGK